MSTDTVNLHIKKGARFDKVFTWKDSNGNLVPMAGLQGRMQIRQKLDSLAYAVELTTENGGMTLGAADGTVTLYMGATATDALTIDNGVYDIEIYDPLDVDNVTNLIGGVVTITQGVTR